MRGKFDVIVKTNTDDISCLIGKVDAETGQVLPVNHSAVGKSRPT
jgi:hypothetical protein